MIDNWITYEETLNTKFEVIKNKFQDKNKQIHTTRLHPDLISNIKVDCYGEEMALQSISNIQLSTARSFCIKPYDSELCDEIEKAIRKNKPDFNPTISSGSITLSFPAPTEDSRKKSVKELKVFSEQTKVSIRVLRQDVQQQIKNNDLPKDLEKKFITNLDKSCKKYNDDIDHLCSEKEKELMTI